MSEVFELCQNDFKKSMRLVQENLNKKAIDDLSFQSVKQALEEAQQQISKMSIQYSSTKDKSMKTRIDIYKKQMQKYKKQYEKVLSTYQNEHHMNELFQEARKENQGYAQNQKLIEGKKLMYQNLQINDNVNLKLKQQTDTLVNARGKMDIINSELTMAHQILNNIKNKMQKNKMVMWIVVAIFIVSLMTIIYTYI